MREIKFRALNKNNEFIYGLPYTDGVNETAYFKEYNNRLCWRRESDGASCNQPYKNGTLSQYTGLKDKNGTEIYEGDLAWDSHNEVTGKIIFDEGKFLYESEDLFEACDEIEIIGNIYENKELLE